jgi:3-methyladenine DNA glycosylase AlkC
MIKLARFFYYNIIVQSRIQRQTNKLIRESLKAKLNNIITNNPLRTYEDIFNHEIRDLISALIIQTNGVLDNTTKQLIKIIKRDYGYSINVKLNWTEINK